MTSTPRLTNGRPLHYIGRGYYVLVDRDDREMSERAPGHVWIGFSTRSGGSIIVMPDHTDMDGLVPLEATKGRAYALGSGLEGEGLILVQPLSVRMIPAGGTYIVDWNPMLDVMA